MSETSVYPGNSRPEKMSARYWLFRKTMRFLGGLFFGFKVIGVENVPRKGRLVIAANHSQYADPVLICMAVPRRMQWMAKKQLFTGPGDWFFTFIGSFAVDRESGGRAGLRSALNFLSVGWALGIFPEGTHRNDGTAREAKSGAVMLAIRGDAPVLPVHVGKIPSIPARLKGERLIIHIGPPFNLDNTLRGGKAYRSAADEVLRVIYKLPQQGPSVEG